MLAGKSVAGARPSSSDDASYFVWGSQDLRARFFSSLGMTVPPEFEKLAGNAFYASVSTEELSRLDSADLMVLVPDDRQSAALSFSSVLSLPELLDSMPAQLAKVVAAMS